MSDIMARWEFLKRNSILKAWGYQPSLSSLPSTTIIAQLSSIETTQDLKSRRSEQSINKRELFHCFK